MKKLMILAAAAMMLTACGNKTKNAATDADSLAVDSAAASQPADATDTVAAKNENFHDGDKFDIHDYYADMNRQARSLLDPEAAILIGDYALFDIDRDGTPEVLVRCPDQEATVVYSIVKGQAKWLAYAEGNSFLEFYEHGVATISSCGTGCRLARYVLIKNSQSVNVASNHKQYDPEGNLSDNEWETENGKSISTEEGEKLFLQLGSTTNFEPDWLQISTE